MTTTGTTHPSTEVGAPSPRRTSAALAFVVVVYGLGPPVQKLITAPSLVSTSVRFWLTLPVLLVLTRSAGRRLPPAVLRSTALPGVMLGLNLVLVFAALQHVSVAVLAMILALHPGVVIAVAGPLLGERPTRWHIAWTGVGLVGVLVVVLGGDPAVRGDALGIGLAVATMLTYTAYYVMNRIVRVRTPIEPSQWMLGVTAFGALAVTPVALLGSSADDYRRLSGSDWVYMAFVVVVVGICGHTLMSWAHRYVPASRSALYLIAMHVVAVAAAWPINHEPIRPAQVAGGAVTLGAVAAVVARGTEPDDRTEAPER